MIPDLSKLLAPQVAPEVANGIQPINPQVASHVGARLSPIRPGDPGYRNRIPKPAPDTFNNVPPPQEHPHPAQEIVAATMPDPPQFHSVTGMHPSADRRLTISFSRKPGKIVVNIETAPDWDIEQSFTVSVSSLREMWPLLERVIKVKDLTGGEAFEDDDESEAVS